MDSFNYQLSDSNQQAVSSFSSSNTSVMASRSPVIPASNMPKKPSGGKVVKEKRYRGARLKKDKWVCEIRVPNKKNRIWLGTYQTAEMAAWAYDVAALALRGKKARLNFADSWLLDVPASKDKEDICQASAEAAYKFQPEELREDDFDMSRFVTEMAEAPLLSPPPSPFHQDWNLDLAGDDMESEPNFDLWA